jgi:hypothetical protein
MVWGQSINFANLRRHHPVADGGQPAEYQSEKITFFSFQSMWYLVFGGKLQN